MRLIVNSSKLDTYDGKIRFYLPYTLQIHEFHLINCSIPYSFYNINEYNNKLLFNNTMIEIPVKQYNAIQLRNVLKILLNINVIFDRQSLKYSFISINPFTLNVLNLGYILGLKNQHTYETPLIMSEGYIVKSENACDMTNRIHNIYIKSNIAPPNIFENNIEGNNILYRIPILCNFGSIIYYQNNTSNLNAEINQSLSLIELYLTDTYNNIIDLNGLSYQLEFFMRTSDDEEVLRNNRYIMGGSNQLTI